MSLDVFRLPDGTLYEWVGFEGRDVKVRPLDGAPDRVVSVWTYSDRGPANVVTPDGPDELVMAGCCDTARPHRYVNQAPFGWTCQAGHGCNRADDTTEWRNP